MSVITLTIVRADDLLLKDANGSICPYVQVYFDDSLVGRTMSMEVYDDSARWNEPVLVEYEVPDGMDQLRCVIVDEQQEEEMGHVVLPLSKCELNKAVHATLAVEPCPGCEDASGSLEIVVVRVPSASSPLRVTSPSKVSKSPGKRAELEEKQRQEDEERKRRVEDLGEFDGVGVEVDEEEDDDKDEDEAAEECRFEVEGEEEEEEDDHGDDDETASASDPEDEEEDEEDDDVESGYRSKKERKKARRRSKRDEFERKRHEWQLSEKARKERKRAKAEARKQRRVESARKVKQKAIIKQHHTRRASSEQRANERFLRALDVRDDEDFGELEQVGDMLDSCSTKEGAVKCRGCARLALLLILPTLYLGLLGVEYQAHGWTRFQARAFPDEDREGGGGGSVGGGGGVATMAAPAVTGAKPLASQGGGGGDAEAGAEERRRGLLSEASALSSSSSPSSSPDSFLDAAPPLAEEEEEQEGEAAPWWASWEMRGPVDAPGVAAAAAATTTAAATAGATAESAGLPPLPASSSSSSSLPWSAWGLGAGLKKRVLRGLAEGEQEQEPEVVHGWLLLGSGFLSGLVGNLAPVQPGLLLAPLFVTLGVCSDPSTTMSLVSAVQFWGNGVIGGLSWASRDVRLISCGALWVIVPFTWLGYLVGSTSHLRLVEWLPPEHRDDPTAAAGAGASPQPPPVMEHSMLPVFFPESGVEGQGEEEESTAAGTAGGGAARLLLALASRALSGSSEGAAHDDDDDVYTIPADGTLPTTIASLGSSAGAAPSVAQLEEMVSENNMYTTLRECVGVTLLLTFVFTVFGLRVGGVNRFLCCPSALGGAHQGCRFTGHWLLVVIFAFSSGYLFLANLGAGVGCTTFLSLSVFLGMETRRAIPTAVVCAGWSSLAPLIAYWLYLQSEPYVRFLLVLPGLWAGGVVAPWFGKMGGVKCNLAFTGLTSLAVGTAILCLGQVTFLHTQYVGDVSVYGSGSGSSSSSSSGGGGLFDVPKELVPLLSPYVPGLGGSGSGSGEGQGWNATAQPSLHPTASWAPSLDPTAAVATSTPSLHPSSMPSLAAASTSWAPTPQGSFLVPSSSSTTTMPPPSSQGTLAGSAPAPTADNNGMSPTAAPTVPSTAEGQPYVTDIVDALKGKLKNTPSPTPHPAAPSGTPAPSLPTTSSSGGDGAASNKTSVGDTDSESESDSESEDESATGRNATAVATAEVFPSLVPTLATTAEGTPPGTTAPPSAAPHANPTTAAPSLAPHANPTTAPPSAAPHANPTTAAPSLAPHANPTVQPPKPTLAPKPPPGGKPAGDKPSGDKPSSDKPSGDKPAGDKPSSDKPSGDKPAGDKPSGDKPSGDKPSGDKPSGGKPSGDKPSGDKPSGDKPSGDKPSGDKPSGDKPSGDKPSGDKPSGDKPSGDKPPSPAPGSDQAPTPSPIDAFGAMLLSMMAGADI